LLSQRSPGGMGLAKKQRNNPFKAGRGLCIALSSSPRDDPAESLSTAPKIRSGFFDSQKIPPRQGRWTDSDFFVFPDRFNTHYFEQTLDAWKKKSPASRVQFIAYTCNQPPTCGDGQTTGATQATEFYRAADITPETATLWQVDLLKTGFPISENKRL
jgi:hypothetical protein